MMSTLAAAMKPETQRTAAAQPVQRDGFNPYTDNGG